MRSLVGSNLAVGYEATIQVCRLVQAVGICRTEVSCAHLGEQGVVAFAHLGLQLQSASLRNHSHRLTYLYISPIRHEQLLQVSTDGRCQRGALLCHALCLSLIGGLGGFVAQTYLFKLLDRHNLVVNQSLCTLIFSQCRLVCQLGLE